MLERRIETLRAIITALYGRLLTANSPTPYSEMIPDQRINVVGPWFPDIENTVSMIRPLLEQSQGDGAASVVNHLKKAEAFDPDMIDNVLESDFDLDPYMPPIKV